VINAAVALDPSPAFNDAGGNRNDVFDRGSDFHADDVRVRIETETGCRQFALQSESQVFVRCGDHQRGRFAGRNFGCEGRPEIAAIRGSKAASARR